MITTHPDFREGCFQVSLVLPDHVGIDLHTEIHPMVACHSAEHLVDRLQNVLHKSALQATTRVLSLEPPVIAIVPNISPESFCELLWLESTWNDR